MFSPNDFEFSGVDDDFTLAAKALNRAYKGSLRTEIERSLFSRVRDPILDGFDIMDPNDIRLYIVNEDLDIYSFPSDINTTMLRLTYQQKDLR